MTELTFDQLEKRMNPRYLTERNVSTVWICLWRHARNMRIADWFVDVAVIIIRYYLRLVKVSIGVTCRFVSVANYYSIVPYGGMENPCYTGNYMTLASGNYFTIAYNELGWIGWGNNQRGQLGDGTTTSTYGGYVRGEYNWKKDGKISKIVCGSEHCLMLTVSGVVFGWGSNMQRQLNNLRPEGWNVTCMRVGVGLGPRMPGIVIDIYADGVRSVCLTRDPRTSRPSGYVRSDCGCLLSRSDHLGFDGR